MYKYGIFCSDLLLDITIKMEKKLTGWNVKSIYFNIVIRKCEEAIYLTIRSYCWQCYYPCIFHDSGAY